VLVSKHLSFLYDDFMKELTVLVADDSAPMLDVVATIMERFGFGRVLKAGDGEEAFSMFQRYNPDLIITDWHMDNVDGLELCKWIRRNKNSVNRSIPIILMTGFTDILRIQAARDSGVTEIIVKPFSAEDLARRIMHVIDVPRDFIESLGFFGPDRRRRDKEFEDAENRRNIEPEVKG
jgi:two-component system chemotaxis response regulator CheY